MAEWIVCPGCRLKHSARPDGTCPRCHQPVGYALAPQAPAAGAWAPTATAPGYGAPAAAGSDDDGLPGAVRVAGVIVILLALSNFAVVAAGQGKSFLVGVSVVDLLLGGALALGARQRGLLAFMIFRVVAGGLVFGIYLWSSQGPIAGLAQATLSAGLLLLLIGRAGPLRFVLGAALAVLVLVVQLAGAAVLMGRDNPLAELNASMQGYGAPVTRLEGEKVRWRLDLPEGHWRLRKTEDVRRENPGIDQMVVWPAKDAAVTVSAADAGEGRVIPLEVATRAVEETAARALMNYKVMARDPLPRPVGQAVLIHATAEAKGQKMEVLFGVFVDGSIAIQVTAVARANRFAELEEELRGIIASLRL